MSDIDRAINQAEEWLQLDGVEGVAQGEQHGEPCIIVFTSRPANELTPLLPAKLAGFSVVIEESGIIQAQ